MRPLCYSSKFLRFQELEVELEEYRDEIERLRAKMATMTTPSFALAPGAVVGRLKLSTAMSANEHESDGNSRKTKKKPFSTQRGATRGSTNPNDSQTKRSEPSHRNDSFASGKGKVVLSQPDAHTTRKESFVTKTRRRAQEAEYYKQVRLAQLEAECELEENIHIRTAREVKARLEVEKKRQTQEAAAAEQRLSDDMAAIREKIAALQAIPDVGIEYPETEVAEVEPSDYSTATINHPEQNASSRNQRAAAPTTQQRGDVDDRADAVDGTSTIPDAAKVPPDQPSSSNSQASDAQQQETLPHTDATTNGAESGYESFADEPTEQHTTPSKQAGEAEEQEHSGAGDGRVQQHSVQKEEEVSQEKAGDAQEEYEDDEVLDVVETSTNDTEISMNAQTPVADDALEISDNDEVQSTKDNTSSAAGAASLSSEKIADDESGEDSIAEGELPPSERHAMGASSVENAIPVVAAGVPDSVTSPGLESSLRDEEGFDESAEKQIANDSDTVGVAATSGEDVAKPQESAAGGSDDDVNCRGDETNDIIARQIESGLESTSHLADHLDGQKGMVVMPHVRLGEAEMKEAMDSAARKIQHFWRQMDARYRRNSDGTSCSNNETSEPTATLPATAADASTVEEQADAPKSTISESPAASPDYTPHSTPRDAESDDQQQSQDSVNLDDDE